MNIGQFLSALVVAIPSAAFLSLTVWGWRGRTHRARFWTRQSYGEGFMLAVCPFFGVIGTMIPLAVLRAPSWVVNTIAIVAGAIALWAVVITLLGFAWWPIQRLWGPRWYVRQSTEQKALATRHGYAPWQSAPSSSGSPRAKPGSHP